MILRLPMCSIRASVLRKRACSAGLSTHQASRRRTGSTRSELEASIAESGQAIVDDIVDPVELVAADAVGRQHVHHVADRAQQHAPRKEEAIEARSQPREVAGLLRAQFERGDAAALPDVRDFLAALESRQLLG